MEDIRSNTSSPSRDSEAENPIGFQERRRFLRDSVPEEIRLFRRILNKITNDDRTYEGYLENILKIHIITPETPVESEQELMTPIVQSFLGMIYEDKETNNTISLYGRLFIDLVDKWSDNHDILNNRQGKILLSTMIIKINEFITDYHSYNIPKEELIEDVKRRRCFCILKFLNYVYDNNPNVIPGKIIMVIMEKFFPKDTPVKELHLEVFLRLLAQNYSRLNNEKLFQVKLKDKYLKFLSSNTNTIFSSRQYNYQIEDTIKLF